MSPSRIAAFLSIAIGVGLGTFIAARGMMLPTAALITLLGTAALEIAFGIGIYHRARAAWSFALASAGVMAVALLLAIPALVRSGVGVGAAGLAIAVVGGQLLLVVSRRDF